MNLHQMLRLLMMRLSRIKQIWNPYHRKLKQVIKSIRQQMKRRINKSQPMLRKIYQALEPLLKKLKIILKPLKKQVLKWKPIWNPARNYLKKLMRQVKKAWQNPQATIKRLQKKAIQTQKSMQQTPLWAQRMARKLNKSPRIKKSLLQSKKMSIILQNLMQNPILLSYLIQRMLKKLRYLMNNPHLIRKQMKHLLLILLQKVKLMMRFLQAKIKNFQLWMAMTRYKIKSKMQAFRPRFLMK